MVHSLKHLVPFALAIGTFFSSAALAQHEVFERQSTTASCSQLHVMIAGGCRLPCASDELGLLDTLIANITAVYPGSDQYLVPYNGAAAQAAVSTPLMIAAANEYAAKCPNTPIVFVGYSLGGIIVMNTLCGGISTNNVIAAIVYGEETYRYPASYDSGTCTNNAPLYARKNTAACAQYASAIRSYCDAADPQCCAGGLYDLAHFIYPSKYDLPALDFIKSQFAAYTPKAASTSSSSVVSSTAASSSTTSSRAVTDSTTPPPSSSTITPTAVSLSSTLASTVLTTITSSTVLASASSSLAATPMSVLFNTSTTIATTTLLSTSTTSLDGTTTSASPYNSSTSLAASSLSASASLLSTLASLDLTSSVAANTTTVTQFATSTTLCSTDVSITVSSRPAISNSTSITSTTTSSIMSLGSAVSSTNGSIASFSAIVTAAKSSATVVLFTGSAPRLPIPGSNFIRPLCNAWKSVGSMI